MWNHSTLSVGSETGMILHSKWALWPSLTSMVFMEEVKTGAWVVCSSYEMIMQKVRFIDLEQKRWKKGSTITKSETYSQIIILQLCFTQYSNFFIILFVFFRLFPIISISQNFFSIFFLTLEKIGIDEKVICYHNIPN